LKNGFSVLKNLKVAQFFSVGENWVAVPNDDDDDESMQL